MSQWWAELVQQGRGGMWEWKAILQYPTKLMSAILSLWVITVCVYVCCDQLWLCDNKVWYIRTSTQTVTPKLCCWSSMRYLSWIDVVWVLFATSGELLATTDRYGNTSSYRTLVSPLKLVCNNNLLTLYVCMCVTHIRTWSSLLLGVNTRNLSHLIVGVVMCTWCMANYHIHLSLLPFSSSHPLTSRMWWRSPQLYQQTTVTTHMYIVTGTKIYCQAVIKPTWKSS